MYIGLIPHSELNMCYIADQTIIEAPPEKANIYQAGIAQTYEDAVLKLDTNDYPTRFSYIFKEDKSFSSREKRGRFYEIAKDTGIPHYWSISDSDRKHKALVTFQTLYLTELLKKFENGKSAVVLGNRFTNTSWVIDEIIPLSGGEQEVTLIKKSQTSYNRINYFGHYDSEQLSSVWNLGKKKIFISHRDTQKKAAKKLASEILVDKNYTCFVAHESIRVNEDWKKEIEKALYTMDALVCFITKDYYKSLWTNQEIGFALAKGVPIFLYSHDMTDPQGFHANIQAIKSNTKDLVENIKIRLAD